MNFKCVNLNTILRDIYYEKNKKVDFSKDSNENNYENFRKDNTKKLKKILSEMGVDILNYKIENNYEIPEFIGDIFKIYLTDDSAKNTFISKIINGKIKDISDEEKKNFIRRAIKILKETGKYDKDFLIDLELCMSIEIINGVNLRNDIDFIIKNSSNLIKSRCERILELNEKIGFLIVNDRIYKNEVDGYKEREDFDTTSYIDMLMYDDKRILLKYLYKMIEDTINNWELLVRIANEEKHVESDNQIQDMIDNNINYEIKLPSSQELLNKSIKAYNDRVIQEIKNKNKIKINDILDAKSIIEEIGAELKEKNNEQ